MATTAQKLTQAEAAYHDLLIGKQARVFVDQNGERIEYNASNRDALRAYIAELKALISNPAADALIRRPMRVWF